ncbi:hypothetical protein TB1_032494 [Malus domestica]
MKSTRRLDSVAIPDFNFDPDLVDMDASFSREVKGPIVTFSEKAVTKFGKDWHDALVIKLLGRSHTYNFLLNMLRQKWQLKGGMQLIDIDHDFYIVKFDLEEDKEFVLTGGPWIIAGQYLTIQKWRP